MNAPTTRSAAKPYGVDQTGKREFHAWVDHRGKRHGLGTFNAKPEALRIAKGVCDGLHERFVIIAAKGQKGPFPRLPDPITPERSADPDFCPEKTLINQMGQRAQNGGQCSTKGPPGPHSHGAAYEAGRDRWRAWVGTHGRRRWVGRFRTKEAAEHAAEAAMHEREVAA